MSVKEADGWADDPINAAGGRRRYNSMRQTRAAMRQAEMIHVLVDNDMSLLTRGTQAALARRFGVSDATASRDLNVILAMARTGSPSCPLCGSRPLTDEAAEEIAAREELLQGWLEDWDR